MKECSRSICIWTYFQRFKIQGFRSISEKGVGEKINSFAKMEEMNVDSLIWWNSKGWCLGYVTLIPKQRSIFEEKKNGETNNSYALMIKAIEYAFFCCPFQLLLCDNVWLCAHSEICLHSNVLYFFHSIY